MSQQLQGVLIAIDWLNIKRGAQLCRCSVRPAELCRAMQDVGRIFGEVVGGKAFGDWSLRPEDGREFAEHDIVPYHAPRTSAGKDRSDPAILLEVYEWIRDREDRGTVILGSGDADYQALVDRARVHGRRIVLSAFSQSVSRDMLALPRYSRLRPSWVSSWRNTATSTWTSRLIPRRATPGIDDVLVRFIQEMYKLEGRLSLVGYSMLCNQWMLDWGLPGTSTSAAGRSTSTSRMGSWNAMRWSTATTPIGPLSTAERKRTTGVSKSRGNVRLSVQHECHSIMPRWYQMMS